MSVGEVVALPKLHASLFAMVLHFSQGQCSFHREIRLDWTSSNHLAHPGIEPATSMLLTPYSN